MGGGKKRRSLTQMTKTQDREQSKGEDAKPSGAPSGKERRTLRIVPPNPEDKGVIKELQKMKVLTPYSVASRFNIRLSTAKDLLEELHHRGVITYVSGGRNIKIYRPSE